MTKPVIVTRAGKGAPLTRAELDANFSNIDDATIGFAGDAGTPISASLNDTININGGNGIGTAVVDGDLVVNLNGVYGGDSTSSTTVGNNTAVLLASVATSGSYNDLTDKPSIPSLPSQTGNAGKFLTTDGTSTSWGTAGGGGNNIALLHLTQLFWLDINSESMTDTYGKAARRNADSVWTINNNGSGVTVGTDNARGYITLPAGTWLIEIPDLFFAGSSNKSIGLWKDGDGGTPKIWKQTKTMTLNGSDMQWHRTAFYRVTLTNSTNYYIKANVPDYTFLSPETQNNEAGGAGVVFKFIKLS